MNPVRIIVGPGTMDRLPEVVHGRPLLITSTGASARGLTGRVADLLLDRDPMVYDRAPSHPTLDDVQQAVATLRHERFDSLLAVGGGSVIDFGKALSAAAAPSAPALEEMIRDGIPTALHTFDVVAVPTTAGTGSEVTPFATIWDTADRQKLSLASPKVYPKAAIIDPELTRSLSWESTLGPGLDALIQCFEAIWNINAAPVPTALAIRGIGLVPDALRALHTDLAAPGPRASMQEAATLSGLAISQTRTALAHSMSYPITAHLGVPHGFACAWVLPGVMAFNLAVDDGRMGPVAREWGIADPGKPHGQPRWS